jgi:hypothetical protein
VSDATPLVPITLDALEAVTGGYHDPPGPPAPSTQAGIAVGEPHPTSVPDRLGNLLRQIGPMIRCFSR